MITWCYSLIKSGVVTIIGVSVETKKSPFWWGCKQVGKSYNT